MHSTCNHFDGSYSFHLREHETHLPSPKTSADYGRADIAVAIPSSPHKHNNTIEKKKLVLLGLRVL
jgi:hypothetical protein